MTNSPSDADVTVIGAGPAGLAAAVAAADAGGRVVLIDSDATVGGQFWRHPAPATGPTRVRDAEVAPLHHRLARYRRLRGRLARQIADGRVRYQPRHEVWAVQADGPRFAVHAVDGRTPNRPDLTVTSDSLVLATGAYDLQIPFPGWDLPGVMTAGGVQSLLKGHGVLAGRRVVVAGTGPFLLSVAGGLLHHHAAVPVVADCSSPARWLRQPAALLAARGKLVEGLGYAGAMIRHRVPYLTRWGVVRADGERHLESVTLAPISSSGRLDPSRSRRIAVDVLAVGWGFVPQLELPLALGCATEAGAGGLPVVVADADQQSTVPRVFVAGEVCGIGGAELAVVEGEIAGMASVHGTAQGSGGDRRWARLRRRASLRRFADGLARVYPPPDHWLGALPDDTVVCRCEEVSAGAVRTAADRDGALDARGAKLLARPGMGRCQGRICGYATECLTAAAGGASPVHRAVERPVAAPIPLGSLVADPAGRGDFGTGDCQRNSNV